MVDKKKQNSSKKQADPNAKAATKSVQSLARIRYLEVLALNPTLPAPLRQHAAMTMRSLGQSAQLRLDRAANVLFCRRCGTPLQHGRVSQGRVQAVCSHCGTTRKLVVDDARKLADKKESESSK